MLVTAAAANTPLPTVLCNVFFFLLAEGRSGLKVFRRRHRRRLHCESVSRSVKAVRLIRQSVQYEFHFELD